MNMNFDLKNLDYQILITCLVDAAQVLPYGSARRDTLDDLRYKLQGQEREHNESILDID